MFNFAHVLTSEIGTVCTDDNDQSVVLANAWFVLLILSFVLAIIFFVLRKPRYGALFTVYLVTLLLARLLNPMDECKHGGLFQFTEQGLIGFGIFSVILFATIVSGGLSYRKSKSHMYDK